MKDFLKYTLATITGIVIVNIIGALLFIGIISAISAVVNKEEVSVKDNSVLVIKLDYEITERTSNNPFETIDFSTFEPKSNLGLNDILKNILKAKTDPSIRGIYLNMNALMAGYGTISEIRDALVDFKKSGKFIIAYAEHYSQRAYYLASVADKVYITPQGTLFFNGLSTNTTFLASLFEKIGIDMQVFKGPDNIYKSAPEVYTNKEYSEHARNEMQVMVNDMWESILNDISTSRNIPKDSLNLIADNFKFMADSSLVEARIIDGLKFKDQAFNEIREWMGIDSLEKINWVSMGKYSQVRGTRNFSKKKIAVLYANGIMVPLEASDGQMSAEKISSELRKIRQDTTISAIVLRINSGGGSSQAAEIIWREAELTRQVKPLVVSMGDVAASGGYYIAANADSIFAERLTITGSIGVFGIIPNAEKLYGKIGITTDAVKTNSYSDFLNQVNHPLKTNESQLIQNSVNMVYKVFLERVANGRGMSTDAVNEVARGRVWSAQKAKDVGLVDAIGTLNNAIEAAATLAKIEVFKVVEYPQQDEFWFSMFSQMNAAITHKIETRILGDYKSLFQSLKEVESMEPIQTRLPYIIQIN